MARVFHPVIDGLFKDVPDSARDEWAAAGWVDRPGQDDNDNNMPAVAGDKEE